jgi:hypothetical protein
MRTGSTSTFTSIFQLTIPKAVWTALHLQWGDQILVWEQNGDIIGQPVKTLLCTPACRISRLTLFSSGLYPPIPTCAAPADSRHATGGRALPR